MRRHAAILIALLLLVPGCRGGSSYTEALPLPGRTGIASAPLGTRAPLPSGALFESLPPDQTGIAFTNPIDITHPQKRLYHSGFACGGVAIGDVTGDGLPDVYFVGGPEANRLYRQTGNLVFEDVTAAAGVDGGNAWGASASLVDIDGDDDLDIYVCNYNTPNLLYVNNGEGGFTERAAAYGIDIVDASLRSTFADYDNDGDLDFYLVTNRYYREGGRPQAPPFAMVDGRPQVLPEFRKYYGLAHLGGTDYTIDEVGRPDRLLRNNGDGSFTDVSAGAGITDAPGHGLSALWWDFNDDGLADIFVGNDFNDPDYLYRNNGNGTFTNVLAAAFPHTSWFSMGSDAADINNDGRLDLMVLDMSATTHFKQKTTMGAMSAARIALVAGPPPQIMRNALFLNAGDGRFMEGAYLAGLASTDWSWAVKFGDLDEDGWADVFVSNGTARNFNHSDLPFDQAMKIGRSAWDFYENTPTRPEANLAFRNQGDLAFEEVGPSWGLDHLGMSYAAALGDLDLDGDLDVLVANLEEPALLYRNRSSSGNRVAIRLKGAQGNSHGIGARVEIETAAGPQVRQLQPFNGFLSSDAPQIHFGLGEETRINHLRVQWPGGREQTFDDLEANLFYVITEPDEGAVPTGKPLPTPTLFRSSDVLAGVQCPETPFDDFVREPLLPNKLSQLGPGLACGDVDGNGDDDLYLGGAAGFPGQLLLQDGQGGFQRGQASAFEPHASSEDKGAIFFDADSDGDLDLYVASGGVECEAGDAVLRDRLYTNDGNGQFTETREALPDLRDSGGAVAAADFDRDGDLDLYVGGRSIPGHYPQTPESRLLRNDGGRFTSVADQVAPDLVRSGLVTSAVWSDADGDGLVDLLVAHEWGPVKFFRNTDGQLVDATRTAGLAEHTGWWNGIAARDVDGDGDIDYVATNFGLNTKYHASADKPAVLYAGDLDGSGKVDLVEAEFEGEVCYPIRGRSCSAAAMPVVGDKFPSYETFALASLEDIYAPKELERANRYTATTLESCVLINDGGGVFAVRPLPRLAQIAPGFGMVMTEVNGDTYPDLIISQNFHGPQAETGAMDGGMGILLLGTREGEFQPVWPERSGIVIPGDAMSLVSTDVNGDGRMDLIAAVNNQGLRVFEDTGAGADSRLTVRLRGPRGNASAIGARVTVLMPDGTSQTAEVSAGGGYLSQSAAALVFGLGSGEQPVELRIVWPDGETSLKALPADTRMTVIAHPGS